MQLSSPDTQTFSEGKCPSNSCCIGQSEHRPLNGGETLGPIRGSSADLPFIPDAAQFNGWLVIEPGMAKLIMRHVFHNIESTKEHVLCHTSSQNISSAYPVVSLFLTYCRRQNMCRRRSGNPK